MLARMDPELDVEAAIRGTTRNLDARAARRQWLAQDQLLFVPAAFPPALVDAWRREAAAVDGEVVTNHMPLARKGGYVGYDVVRARCPAVAAAYRSPALIELVAGLAGRPLHVKPDHDPHACAIHVYRDPGDFVAWHYDTCGARKHTSYTVLIGVVDRSRMRLDCRLRLRRGLDTLPSLALRLERRWLRRTVRMAIATAPGSLLAFSGSTIWHRLTEMGPGEERIVLSFAYRTDYRIGGVRWLREQLKDALVYDGVRKIREVIARRGG